MALLEGAAVEPLAARWPEGAVVARPEEALRVELVVAPQEEALQAESVVAPPREEALQVESVVAPLREEALQGESVVAPREEALRAGALVGREARARTCFRSTPLPAPRCGTSGL